MKNWLLVLVLMLLVGCNLGAEADRATYDAIAPEYLAYVASDATLTPAQKERRVETVRSWEAKTKPSDPDAVTTEDAHLSPEAHLGPCDYGIGPCGCGTSGCIMPCSGCCDSRGGCWANPAGVR